MADQYWDNSVCVHAGSEDGGFDVDSTYDAIVCLLEWWPGRQRGRSYARAVETCRSSLKGLRLTRSAQKAFLKAVRDAGFTISFAPPPAYGAAKISQSNGDSYIA